jgi:hypothetical protein
MEGDRESLEAALNAEGVDVDEVVADAVFDDEEEHSSQSKVGLTYSNDVLQFFKSFKFIFLCHIISSSSLNFFILYFTIHQKVK